MFMNVGRGPSPKLVGTLHRVRSCSDFQERDGGAFKLRLHSADPSRAETPQFLQRLDSRSPSLERVVAAVAEFFRIQQAISQSCQSPESELVLEEHARSGDSKMPEFELFPVGETKYTTPWMLSNLYQIHECQKTRLGWEGVSRDPAYAGSVFIVSEGLAPLDFSNMQPKQVAAEIGPYLDPNCKYCSRADFIDWKRSNGEREGWMKKCFETFDKNAELFLETDQAQARDTSSWLLEPEDTMPEGKMICADCQDLLAPFLTRELYSVDYSPSVWEYSRPIYTCKVTRELSQQKFEQYSKMYSQFS